MGEIIRTGASYSWVKRNGGACSSGLPLIWVGGAGVAEPGRIGGEKSTIVDCENVHWES